MNSKKQLEVALSKLEQVKSPKVNLEQYITPSEIAAEVLWTAFMNNDVKDKVVADLGCGNGILGVGASLLGAKKVIFLDGDRASLLIAKKNFEGLGNGVFLNMDVSSFKERVDTVIENPPFGVQNLHADREFLIKAMENSKKIYSFHKIESKNFVEAITRDKGFKLDNLMRFKFRLNKTHEFHRKEDYFVDVGCFVLGKL